MTDENDERLQLSLAANALDFLKKAVQETASGDANSLKYAILHLADGTELLLKARLANRAWYLLFANVDNADQTALSTGDFKSVELDVALERLEKLAGVTLSGSEASVLKSLRNLRNRFRHYAADVNLNEARALLGKTLAFSLSFCEEELQKEIEAEGVDISDLSYAPAQRSVCSWRLLQFEPRDSREPWVVTIEEPRGVIINVLPF